uniref:Smoothelin like 1 n=1 Tax=Canis lupus dingo TaxID=286419 RepID=A0A8C0JH47_CANLU
MEQKEGKPTEDGTTVSPNTEAPETLGGGASAEEAKGSVEPTVKETPPVGAGKQERAAAEDGTSPELQGEANGLDEVKVAAKVEAELHKEDGGKEESTVAPQEMTDGKEETQPGPKEAEEALGTTLASGKQQADEKEAKPESQEEARVNDEAKAEPTQAAGEQEAKTGAREADGKEEAKGRREEEPGGPKEEQDQGVERESEEGAGAVPSSPEEWLESPTEEGSGLSPDGVGPDAAASGETSPSASESSPSDAPQSPTEPPASQEKKKEKAPERRVSAPARPRGPRAQNRKAIVDKFGGAASGPTALFRNTKAAGAAIGGVKNMLLEWCRAMTRNYEHVDIQNFSSSWSSGMAFCALIHKFFPDAFDYAALEPTQRRHNFTLAFSTAEKLADCAQLLEVDDMVRLAVPDSKCVYTYIQELYRSLVQKGLVKTKKK